MKARGGSALLLVLLVCLGACCLALALGAIYTTAEGALADEREGRTNLAPADQDLAFVTHSACLAWQPADLLLPSGSRGSLTDAVTDTGWSMTGSVPVPGRRDGLRLEGTVERGRDGLDLHPAALVADALAAGFARPLPLIETEPGEEDPPVVFLCSPSRFVPAESIWLLEQPGTPWRLDLGTAARLTFAASGEQGEAVTPGVTVLRGERGTARSLTCGEFGRSSSQPVLAVLLGGADLDASGLGDLYGVIVVDEGSVELEGTRVHGSVLVSGTADLGTEGQIFYSLPILR